MSQHSRFFHALLLVGSIGFAPFVAAQQLPATVQDALKRTSIPPSAAAVYVQAVNADKPLVAHNHSSPFNPASTMKLVTTNAALELLGPSFTWKTQAYAAGTQSGDVLNGDLIFKGGGDSKLVLENFWLFLRQIRARGIREIRGNVVLDRSIFEDAYHDASKFDGDPSRPYNASPDALLVNYKAFSFRFLPNHAVGSVSVSVDPPVAGYPVVSPKLGNGDCGDWKQKLRMNIDGTSVDFTGTYSAACGEKVWHVHPFQMTQNRYFNLVFRQLWHDLGGTLAGEVKSGNLPANARLITQWESPALSEAIKDINKFSNNVMARQLLLTLAAQLARTPATADAGAQAVKSWLASKRIDATELVIENGSGLSRIERITAATMGRMLVAAYHAPTMPEFISSMPLVGYDGTMRSRLKERGIAGHAHIKTGMLNDVRAVSGYVLAASGKRYAVAAFVNHGNSARGTEVLDALLQWVYENG